MFGGLKWIASEDDLYALVSKDACAYLTEATDDPSKKWKLIFEKLEKDKVVNFTPALYMNTLEDAFDKVTEYCSKGYNYNRINQEITKYYEDRNSDIAP